MTTDFPCSHADTMHKPVTDPRLPTPHLQDVAVPAINEHPFQITRRFSLLAPEEFRDGFNCGWLEYWLSEQKQPLTATLITNFLYTNMHDPRASATWNAGYCLGWLVAGVFCPDLADSPVPEREQEQPAATVDHELNLGIHTLFLLSDGGINLVNFSEDSQDYFADNALHLSDEEAYRLFVSLQELYRK